MSTETPADNFLPNGLRDVRRYITTHDDSGKAIISDAVSPAAKWDPIGGGIANFFLGYTTHTFPVAMDPSVTGDERSAPKDLVAYQKDREEEQSLSNSNGTVLRFVDFAPDCPSFMHRTASLDYGVVLEGTIELELDGGDKRTLHRGDVCVQRGTNHAWHNATPNNGWARMMFVLVAANQIEVAGEKLGEVLNDMPDVKPNTA